jgi:hypothetical protein
MFRPVFLQMTAETSVAEAVIGMSGLGWGALA